MKKSHIRNLIALVVLVAIGAGGYVFMQNRPLTVDVVQATADAPVRIFGLGTVEARVLSRVGFEVSGTVEALAVDQGDVVQKGALLARLNSAEQEARLKQAEATRLAAEMNIHKAEANVLRARAVYEQRLEDSTRKQSLADRNAVSQQQAGEAVRDEKVAAAELTVAESEVDVARAQLADADAKLTFERTILDQHALRAPYDALVIERLKEAGSVTNAGEVIFSLLAPDSIWILAYVDEQLAGGLAIGQPAEIRLRSLANTPYHGKVARIGLESDRANEERKVWLSCEDCPAQIFLGEQSESWVTVAQLKDALLVPQNAITDFDGARGKVWVLDNGALRQVVLTFGLKTEDARYQVLDGLPKGAVIVTSRGPGLREGRSASARQDKP